MIPYQHKVQYYETDKMGITHHSNYIRWMEEARIDFLSQRGWSYEKLEAMGLISPVTAVNCHYKNSTTFAEEITIRVWIEEFKGVRLKIGYEMRRGETVVFIGQSEHCFLNKEGKIISLKREYPEIYSALINGDKI
ncbi:MAG: acyl-CoA thioesterase [Oscillospiraceae bacterium]|nr:acyl-CoA thioesterase [Oscillospiraceae bacterium]